MKKRQLKKNVKKENVILVENVNGGKLMPCSSQKAIEFINRKKAKFVRSSKPAIKLVG